MMDDDQRDAVLTLQGAEVGEQHAHLSRAVLIAAVQPHEGIENEQPRLVLRDGGAQPRKVALVVEPQARYGDQANR